MSAPKRLSDVSEGSTLLDPVAYTRGKSTNIGFENTQIVGKYPTEVDVPIQTKNAPNRLNIFSAGSAFLGALTFTRGKSANSSFEKTQTEDAYSTEVDDPMQTKEVEEAESLESGEWVDVPAKPWHYCRPPNKEDTEAYEEYKKSMHGLMSFLFSHVGLTSLVIGYIVMGGFIFQYLEGKSEIVERATISKKRNATVTRASACLVKGVVVADAVTTIAFVVCFVVIADPIDVVDFVIAVVRVVFVAITTTAILVSFVIAIGIILVAIAATTTTAVAVYFVILAMLLL